MPSKFNKQHRFMKAITQKVGREFVNADKIKKK